jgi:aquaporin Z
MFTRQKVAALVGELLGAGVLTLLILSVQRSTIGVPFFVAIAAGLTVALMSFTVGGASGGYFNPALTLGFWTARRISTARAILYIAAQMLGAWFAYSLYTYFVNNTLQSVGGHYSGRILAAEAVGSGILAFGFAAAVYQGFSRAVTASFYGLALVIGMVAASSASLGLLNPAVALGVRAWVLGTYVLGPILGAVIGINLYALLFTDSGARDLAAAVSTSSATTKTAKKNKK